MPTRVNSKTVKQMVRQAHTHVAACNEILQVLHKEAENECRCTPATETGPGEDCSACLATQGVAALLEALGAPPGQEGL
jgi:hypothetical protein